jgi:release factor glutamine methyltransferase
LLAHVLGRNAAWLLAHDDAVLSEDEADRFRAAVARRVAGEPVPYIIGTAGFYGRLFHVDPDVLVPRPESEAIVDEVLDHLRSRNASEPLLCDVGTGSGALAVTLACERGDARLVAVDLSPAALAVAARNARDLGVAERISFVLGDGLAAAAPAGARFACVVANLPYVKTADLPLAPDPASFEPRLALDGGSDGLACYRPLLAHARSVLAPDGLLVMEAGPDTASDLEALARAAFAGAAPVGHAELVEARIVRDRAGLDRLVIVRIGG